MSVDTVEILGRTYLRSDVEAALAATGKQQLGEAMRSDLSGYTVAASQVRRGYDVECDRCGKFCDTGPGPCQQVGEVQGDAGFDNQMGSPAFEVWAKANDYSLHRDPSSLNYTGDTLHAWWAWRHLAARQPGAVE